MHSYNSLNSQKPPYDVVGPCVVKWLQDPLACNWQSRSGTQAGYLWRPCSWLFFYNASVCNLMVFLIRGFGRQVANVQQPEMGLLCLYKTISLALLAVTIINVKGQRPWLHSKEVGAAHLLVAACCKLLTCMSPCLYEIEQSVAASSKAVSNLLETEEVSQYFR